MMKKKVLQKCDDLTWTDPTFLTEKREQSTIEANYYQQAGAGGCTYVALKSCTIIQHGWLKRTPNEDRYVLYVDCEFM